LHFLDATDLKLADFSKPQNAKGPTPLTTSSWDSFMAYNKHKARYTSEPKGRGDNLSGVVELEVVRDEPRKMGRPLFLNARRFLRICGWIEKGESAVDACRRELVTYAAWRSHIQRNVLYQKRLRKAEAVRESFLKEYHIANITKHAPKSILASLWWLERRYPADFALRAVNRDQALEEKPVGNAIPLERLREYSQLMAEFSKEQETSQPAVQLPNAVQLPDAG
jgi:hypothetical protein